jgi:hypothetical protein
MYSQLRAFPEILPYMMRKRLRVVHLVRHNHLDVLISFAIKRKIGRAHLLTPEDRPKDVSVDIDPTSLLRDLRKLQFKHSVGRQLLRVSKLNHIEVAYEDLVESQSHFDDVLAFLHVSADGQPPLSHIFKTRLASQEQIIRNYEEVKRVLETSQFAALLE